MLAVAEVLIKTVFCWNTCILVSSDNIDYSCIKQAAIADYSFAPSASDWCSHLVDSLKRVVIDSSPFTPLCENIMLCTKTEVHNIFHC